MNEMVQGGVGLCAEVLSQIAACSRSRESIGLDLDSPDPMMVQNIENLTPRGTSDVLKMANRKVLCGLNGITAEFR